MKFSQLNWLDSEKHVYEDQYQVFVTVLQKREA